MAEIKLIFLYNINNNHCEMYDKIKSIKVGITKVEGRFKNNFTLTGLISGV